MATDGLWGPVLRRLLADGAARFAAILLLGIALACTGAPLYATHVAHTDPFRSNISGEITVDGVQRHVIEDTHDQPTPAALAPS